MATNPYDRRGRDPELRAMKGMVGADSAFGYTSPRQSPVDFQDLEAMTANAFRRGSALERERLAGEHVAELGNARRDAWQEGYGAAMVDGRDSLLEVIDRQFGNTVRGRVNACRTLLTRAAGDPRKVSKAELVLALDNAADLLGELVDAHHSGFMVPRADEGEPVRVASTEEFEQAFGEAQATTPSGGIFRVELRDE